MTESKIDTDKIDEEKWEEIKSITWLSPREAEIFLLRKKTDSLKETAEEIGIAQNTIYKHWRNIKDKVRTSRETIELDVET